MNEVRLGVIGCGGMAQGHMSTFHEIKGLRFTAASDSFAANLDKVVDKYKVKGFADGHALIKSGECDAILIATPHYFHPEYSIAGLDAGLHVITEKPVSVTAKEAQAANDAAKRNPKLRYAVNFQARSTARYRKARELIQSGAIGPIMRVQWTATGWFRTQAYYNSGSWRATWHGEGGGVLINQCPHNLDILCWLVGSPSRVSAIIGLGKYHNIEVEDDVTAILEFPNGATGVFITTTGESPGSDFFEIVGEKGKLTMGSLLPPNTIEFIQNEVSSREFSANATEPWASLPTCKHLISVSDQGGQPKTMMQNFVNSILKDEPLIAPAV